MRRVDDRGTVEFDIGEKVGSWTIIGNVTKRKDITSNHRYYPVRCSCGKESIVPSYNLACGRSTQCRSCAATGSRISDRKYATNTIFHDYKKTAARRGIEFKLSKSEIAELIFKDCYYCGLEPKNYLTRKNNGKVLYYNGIDRLNSDKPYLDGNVVTCCQICNVAKSTRHHDEFMNWVKTIYKEHYA